MEDRLKTISLTGEITVNRGKKVLYRCCRSIFRHLSTRFEDNVNPITKRFQKEINDIFDDTNNFPTKINNVLDMYLRLLKKIDLKSEKNRKQCFRTNNNFCKFLIS